VASSASAPRVKRELDESDAQPQRPADAASVVDEIGVHEIFPSVKAALVPKEQARPTDHPASKGQGSHTDHPAFVGEPISFARSPGPSHRESAGPYGTGREIAAFVMADR
jgi:hypothetical protein